MGIVALAGWGELFEEVCECVYILCTTWLVHLLNVQNKAVLICNTNLPEKYLNRCNSLVTLIVCLCLPLTCRLKSVYLMKTRANIRNRSPYTYLFELTWRETALTQFKITFSSEATFYLHECKPFFRYLVNRQKYITQYYYECHITILKFRFKIKYWHNVKRYYK